MFWLFGQVIGLILGFIMLRVLIQTFQSIFGPTPERPIYKTPKNPETAFEDTIENEDV